MGKKGIYRLVLGTTILTTTHLGDLEVFCFGGRMEVKGDDERTECIVTSPAPMYRLKEEKDVLEVFLEEIEMLLAREHAKWGRDDQEFRNRLSGIHPTRLYASCLVTLQEKFESREYKGIRHVEKMRQFLRGKMETLDEGDVPKLSSLL